MSDETYFCPVCATILTWDAGGVMSGIGFSSWYCNPADEGCGNIIPPDSNYPAPTE
jgi:hypothetical protein